ncbi:NAD dependent epimerase/dehydratase [Mycena albidolilacea]|uniref:NAD dependent epimerase/dehydratase n=1 Tax=Mycena albidolilacea TaxID=1033008 RepID=A0AAD7EEL1_9AGAR|nr:NAD dependent epimerase/dehydratase [Mycena albidolilacea]
MPNTYLITTATGRQGTSTARLLLAQGAQVHALVRDLTSPASLTLKSLGATLFKGGFDDGVTGVFFNTFPNFADPNGEARDAETLVAAARTAGTVTSFVVSTVFKTDALEDWSTLKGEFPFLAQYYASKAGVEHVVRASGFTYTILRPGWLNHNYIGAGVEYHFPEYAKERVLTVSSPRGWRMEHLDAADVGQFAAAALLDPGRFAGKELDLLNELLTFEEIAAHLGEALGAEVEVKYRTAEDTAEARKVLPTIERQLWGPTTAPGDASKLAEYGFRLTTLKEFLEREKSAIRKTVGIEG